MKIDEDFIKGVAYYIGDGRMTAPRSLSTANQDIETIKFFISWLQKYFDINKEKIKIKIMVAQKNFNEQKLGQEFSKKLGIDKREIHSVKQKYKAKPHHNTIIEIWANNTSAKRRFNNLIPKVKDKCLVNKRLALAYLKGIMAAEGSPKYNIKRGIRTIHLKMKDEKEIRFIGHLLNSVLKIKSSVLKVKNEEGMWLITISGIKEIQRLNELDLFEIESRKKDRLNKMANSYKREQVKKGLVKEFYLKNLKLFNKKMNRHLTASELAKLIKRDRTRTISVLRKLEKENLIKSIRRKTTGRPFEFWI